MHADVALRRVISEYRPKRVLDIGSGTGEHAEEFRKVGAYVVEVDPNCDRDGVIKEQYENINWDKYDFDPFDVVWVSHVLEHQKAPIEFLSSLHRHMDVDSVLAVTVPPMKRQIVGGHYSVWNAGLLLYNLVIAGYNCSRAKVKKYGYNISVVVQHRWISLPPLMNDAGDLERLAAAFPIPVSQGFDGDIEEVNWE